MEPNSREILMVGFSVNLLKGLRGWLPAGSIVVVEEPDVSRKRNLAALAEQFPEVADVLECRYQDDPELEAFLEAAPGLGVVRAVVPGVEYAVPAAALIAERLGLPGAGAEAARVFRDKYALRQAAGAAGLRNPTFALVETPEQAVSFMQDVAVPCVLKPTGRQASLGVQILRSPAEVVPAWDLVQSLDEGVAVPDRGVTSRIMIETLVVGDEYSVEILVRDADPCFVNVTGKSVAPGPFPVELGHVVPAVVDPTRRAALADATAALARATGFGTGVLHAEWIAAEDGLVLVECAARMPGDEIPALLTRAWGFPFTQTYLQCLLAEKPEIPEQASGAAAIRFLLAEPGDVETVSGAEAARSTPGVDEVVVSVQPGGTVGRLRSSWDRIGWVTAHGPDAQAAQSSAIQAAHEVIVRTRS